MMNIKPYNNYKQSGSKWLGKVPTHWEVRNLRTVIKSRSERNQPQLPLLSVAREKGVFVRSLTGEDDNHNAIPEDLTNYKVAKKGDLVINKMKAWQGSMGVAPCEGIVSPAYYVYALNIASSRFAQYLFRSKPYVAHFGQASDGVRIGQWDLSIQGMKQIPVLVPPPDEQEDIVKFLDWANGRIDSAIRYKRKIISLLNEQKGAIIQRALTLGITPNTRLRATGISYLDKLPEKWAIRRLKFCIQGKLKYGANEANEFDNPTWPRYIRITDFSNDGSLRQDTFCSLPPDIAKDYLVQDGDILFARSGGTVGKTFLVNIETSTACFAGYLIRAKCNKSILNPKFLFLYTQSNSYKWWKDEIFNRATIQNIGADKYSNLLVPLPDLDEQEKIVSSVKGELMPIETTLKRIQREIQLLIEYRNILTANTVTGKIDVSQFSPEIGNSATDVLTSLEREINPMEDLGEENEN